MLLPLRNIPVIAPAMPIDGESIDPDAVAESIQGVLKRMELDDPDLPVAIFVPWRGSATFQRLDAFCRGVASGVAAKLARGHPLVLAGDGDVGGLIGIHFREEMQLVGADRLHRRAGAARISITSTSARCWRVRAPCRW